MQGIDDLKSNAPLNPDATEALMPKFKLTTKQLMAMGLAATTIVGASIFGLNGCSSAKTTDVKPSTTTETPTNNQNTIESSGTSENTGATTPEEDTDIYSVEIQQYREMSVDEFESQPLDERLPYATYLREQTVYRGNYDRVYQNKDSYINYVPVTKNNTGQEIYANEQFARQIAAIQFIEGDSTTNNTVFDSNDGQKALSAVFYKVGDNNQPVMADYISIKSWLKDLPNPVYLDLKETVTDTSDLLTGKNSGGQEVQYKIITTDGEYGVVYYRYIYHDFISYDKEKQSIWLLDMSMESIDEMNRTPIS